MKSESPRGIILCRQNRVRREQSASARWATQLRLWIGVAAIALTCGLTAVAQQSNQLASMYQRSFNVQACGYGFGECNESLLSPIEAAQASAIRHHMNVQACGYGFGECDERLLSPTEAAQVSAIRHRMNVQACSYGFGQCDEGRLSQAEAAQAGAIRHRMSRLTPPDSAVVRSTGGAGECLASSYLSPSLVETPAAVQTSHGTELNALLKALLTSVGAPVAENGSYFGEPNKNGVPKTVLVNGYTRSNGTYVQGYYRSAPGSNPVR